MSPLREIGYPDTKLTPAEIKSLRVLLLAPTTPPRTPSSIPCRNGRECWHHGQHRCWFRHFQEPLPTQLISPTPASLTPAARAATSSTVTTPLSGTSRTNTSPAQPRFIPPPTLMSSAQAIAQENMKPALRLCCTRSLKPTSSAAKNPVHARLSKLRSSSTTLHLYGHSLYHLLRLCRVLTTT